MTTRYARVRATGTVLTLVCAGALSAGAQHATDIWVGRTAAGQLKRGGFEVESMVVVLPPVGGIIRGWAGSNPGFDRVVAPDPPNDLFPMEPGADIRARIEFFDPAFRMIGPGGAPILMNPGQEARLGDHNLHTHWTWHINSDDPSFDPLRVHWRATFVLLDMGSTGYSDSEQFTIVFSNVACDTGDVNADGAVDAFDIEPFIDVLLDPAGASAVERCAADADLDGIVDAFDIEPFIDALVGP